MGPKWGPGSVHPTSQAGVQVGLPFPRWPNLGQTPQCEASGSPRRLPAELALTYSPPHASLTTCCHSGNLVLLLPHTTPINSSKPWLLPFPLSGMFFCQVFAWPGSSHGSGLHTNITSSEKCLTIPHVILFRFFVQFSPSKIMY